MVKCTMEPLRKRLRYRAARRGTKEMDLILNNFANKNLANMNPTQLRAFDDLLAIADPDLENYLKKNLLPPSIKTENHALKTMLQSLKKDYLSGDFAKNV